MTVLRLAVPCPLRRLFDYLPPEGMAQERARALQPGIRVRVPFGGREMVACLLAVSDTSEVPADSLKQALEVLDPAPLLSPNILALCRWASDYYHHPPGEVLSAAFPTWLRRGRPSQAPGRDGWRITDRGQGLPPGAPARSPRQARALDLLRPSPGLDAGHLEREGISRAVLRELARKGLIEPCRLSDAAVSPASDPGLALNPEQAAAVAALSAAAGQFGAHLLEGVTGSGKTEVYLQLIAQCLERGEQALVLIPEIGLTPQTITRFEDRFQAEIAVFHSGLADGARYRAWESARRGEAHIVIGTRSAVFTPLKRCGLVIVDEEHDLSYKQQDGFRYSARDVAVKRGQIEHCPVLLGSATPSLESLNNALSGRYGHHRLTERAGAGQLPAVDILDVRRKPLQAGMSGQLLSAVENALGRGEQVLLFLNRRGYAPTLQCHDCGWIAGCAACDARLTVHRRRRQLRCHHCGAAQGLPRTCPNCHSGALLTGGLGTEQAEEVLRGRFPDWPVHRVDSDTMQAKTAMADMIRTLQQREPAIVLGTQMLAKGHHFPAVGLVAVIDADGMLFSSDFRGEERMAQLLTQVAGRAGRAELPGRVLLQTHYPDHPALCSLLTENYASRARTLLQRRREAGLPPAGQLILLRSDSTDPQAGEDFLQQLRSRLASRMPAGCHSIGPLPAPMQRRAGRYRYQLMLSAADRARARRLAVLAVEAGEALQARRGLSWSLDIDPQEF